MRPFLSFVRHHARLAVAFVAFWYVWSSQGRGGAQAPDTYEELESRGFFIDGQPTTHSMVLVPGGVYKIGLGDDDIVRYLRALRLDPDSVSKQISRINGPDGQRAARLPPAHEVEIEPFYILDHEVTNRAYQQYVLVGGNAPNLIMGVEEGRTFEKLNGWRGTSYPAGHAGHPVMGVALSDAERFCVWLSARTHIRHRLPTEEEWEAAYRGKEGFLFPWGDSWNATTIPTVNRSYYTGPDPAWATKADVTPTGIFQMLGNLREWTWSASLNKHVAHGMCFSDDLEWSIPSSERMERSHSTEDATGFRYIIRLIDGRLEEFKGRPLSEFP